WCRHGKRPSAYPLLTPFGGALTSPPGGIFERCAGPPVEERSQAPAAPSSPPAPPPRPTAAEPSYAVAPEDDIPEDDDPDLNESALSGHELIVRELGATVVEEFTNE
ncbi:DNA polymerase III subunit gamma and tau, partial [Streptomyces sp. XM83C]|nr:DNA polymerase III subunit gamma and tau [Streptomyces sp. XM83C]